MRRCAQFTKNIELSGGCDYEDGLTAKLVEIKRQRGLNFLLHGYFPPPPTGHFIMNFAENSDRTSAFIKEAAACIRVLEIPYYSVHSGFKKSFSLKKEILIDLYDKNTFTVEDIGQSASYFKMEYPDIRLALENLYPNPDRHCCFMIHIEEITGMLDRFPGIYLLLDLGHLKISSHLTGFNYAAAVELLFRQYAHRILELHLSENDGLTDRHWPIRGDSVQYDIVRQYADVINERGINVVIETRNSDFEAVKECFLLINGLLR
ncbi:sugar phosphate isomerase/epimerase family protein [Candidatus Magnetominusculus dajiuhuensis]|uniref:sugar phosphate isomerase/epimerase family protein n=1 Tax=Candidatus Magnetominusculus dajiuhuensis TaxID=3137712 RepID=UPI003B43175A